MSKEPNEPTPPTEAATLAGLLEEANAKCSAAIGLVDALEAALTRSTAHMTPQDQATLFHARAFLELWGVRKGKAWPEWQDRR